MSRVEVTRRRARQRRPAAGVHPGGFRSQAAGLPPRELLARRAHAPHRPPAAKVGPARLVGGDIAAPAAAGGTTTTATAVVGETEVIDHHQGDLEGTQRILTMALAERRAFRCGCVFIAADNGLESCPPPLPTCVLNAAGRFAATTRYAGVSTVPLRILTNREDLLPLLLRDWDEAPVGGQATHPRCQMAPTPRRGRIIRYLRVIRPARTEALPRWNCFRGRRFNHIR